MQKIYIMTDIENSKTLCLVCSRLHDKDEESCHYCGSLLYQRKPFSISLTWAYLIASLLFLFPANTFFMMKYSVLGRVQHGTILSGIIDFYNAGDVAVAIIIFIASIVVPIFKILMLIYMLLIVHLNLNNQAKFGLKIYKFIHFIGKWSMLDIFVVATMVSLVQFGSVDIDAQPAVYAFTAVVFLTILATNSFDPRLMFDNKIKE